MSLASLANLLMLVGLVAIMLSMGLKVTFDEVSASMRKPRLVALAVVANFLVVPAVTMGLLRLFGAAPMVSVGFLILAVSPGAPLGPPFAAIARGDLPSAIGQMVVLASLSTLLTPALLAFLLTWLLPASELKVDYLAIVKTLLVAQILPLAIGLVTHHWAPKLTEWIARPVRTLANLLLVGAIVVVLVKEYETLEFIRLRGWLAMVLLLVTCCGIGWLCGGPGRATRKSMALTTGIRNVAVALILVAKNFEGTPAVPAVVAYAFVSILGTLICAFLLAAVPESPSGR